MIKTTAIIFLSLILVGLLLVLFSAENFEKKLTAAQRKEIGKNRFPNSYNTSQYHSAKAFCIALTMFTAIILISVIFYSN